MNVQQTESCRAIANFYGLDSQSLIAIEEMSELTKELCKNQRGYDRNKDIIEELADVSIMIEQLIALYECEKEVSDMIDYKVNRQLRRMEHERE